MAAILMTLRDSSRAGFMAAYARLLQLAMCGETSIQKMAQYYLVVYQQSKYKSKQTQNLITTNCEDMLRDVFCVDEGTGVKLIPFSFTAISPSKRRA